MNKFLSLLARCGGVPALVLGIACSAIGWAATTNAAPSVSHPPPPATAHAPAAGGPPQALAHPQGAVASALSSFTPADWKELRDARETALKTNPELTKRASELADKVKAFQRKLDDAMIRVNPNVAETITKLERITPQSSLAAPPSRFGQVPAQQLSPSPAPFAPAH